MADEPKEIPSEKGSERLRGTLPLEYEFAPWEYDRKGAWLGKVTATLFRYGDINGQTWGFNVIDPGAFDKLLNRLEVGVTRMHHYPEIVARAGSGLTIIQDYDALRCEIELPDTFYGRMVRRRAGLWDVARGLRGVLRHRKPVKAD